jgi:Fe-S-cluster containining protein
MATGDIHRAIHPEPETLPDRERAVAYWREELARLLEKIKSPASAQEVAEELESGRPFRRVFEGWMRLTPRERRRRWTELARATEKAAYATRAYCLRCGECCRKAAPGLRQADLQRLGPSGITMAQLLTLRRGERAWSELKRTPINLAQEMVKLRPTTEGACPFLRAEDASCTIYEDRPLECRVLECWNPDGFNRVNQSPRLARKGVIIALGLEPLLALVNEHERLVPFSRALELAGKPRQTRPGGDTLLLAEIIQTDERLRRVAMQTHSVPEDALDFLFGRPLRTSLGNLL